MTDVEQIIQAVNVCLMTLSGVMLLCCIFVVSKIFGELD